MQREAQCECGQPWPGSDWVRCTEPPGHGGPHVRDLGGDVYCWSFQPAPRRRAPGTTNTPPSGDPAAGQVVGTVVVVVGNPLPARSGPMTTTTSNREAFATGTDAVRGCTDVAATSSCEATSAAAASWEGA